MTNERREAILKRIGASISSHGYHIRVVDGGPSPRFVYTIGLYQIVGFELVFAGASFFTLNQAKNVVNQVADLIKSSRDRAPTSLMRTSMGSFSLGEVDISWSKKLLLGALDYFDLEQVRTLQIIPSGDDWTFDIPNMGEAWNPAIHPAWKWLEASWKLPVSPNSKAITNLNALKGHPITEVMRWDENEWEMFAGAGPDVEEDEIRIVPLATLIAQDESLEDVVRLNVGAGLWREDGRDQWHPWGKRGDHK